MTHPAQLPPASIGQTTPRFTPCLFSNLERVLSFVPPIVTLTRLSVYSLEPRTHGSRACCHTRHMRHLYEPGHLFCRTASWNESLFNSPWTAEMVALLSDSL